MCKQDSKQFVIPACSTSLNRQDAVCACLPDNHFYEGHSSVDRMILSIRRPYIYNNVRARGLLSMMLLFMLANVCEGAVSQSVQQQYDVERGVSMSFPINGAKLDADFGENKHELESMSAIISQVAADSSASIRRIVVCGYGSPDGPYAFNEKLAKKRADALVAKLKEGSRYDDKLIEVSYVAEDWDGLTEFIEEATLEQMPNREAILEVISSNRRPDEKERVIRKRYPKDFKYLKDHVLQKLRRSEYRIEYVTNQDPNAPLDSLSALRTGAVRGNQQQAAQNHDTKNNLQQSQQSSSLKMWRALLIGLLLLMMLAAGYLIYRSKSKGRWVSAKDEETADDESDDTENISPQSVQQNNEHRNPSGIITEPKGWSAVASAAPVVASVVPPVAENDAPEAENDTPETENDAPEAGNDAPEAENDAPEAENDENLASGTHKDEIIAFTEAIDAAETDDNTLQEAPVNHEEPSLLNSSEDFEIFQRMDREVTEKRLYLNAEIDRKQLMTIAKVDKNRFAVLIRQFAGTNFSGYINAKRLEYAKQLISEHPEYTMKTVAKMCGFNSQSTFFRVFKSVYGTTPIELSQMSTESSKSPDNQGVSELSKSQSGQNCNNGQQLIRFDIDE
jgi:AraC-like DNA-binding protein